MQSFISTKLCCGWENTVEPHLSDPPLMLSAFIKQPAFQARSRRSLLWSLDGAAALHLPILWLIHNLAPVLIRPDNQVSAVFSFLGCAESNSDWVTDGPLALCYQCGREMTCHSSFLLVNVLIEASLQAYWLLGFAFQDSALCLQSENPPLTLLPGSSLAFY